MVNKQTYSVYDDFAFIYNKHWGNVSLAIYPKYDELVFKLAPLNAKVLDLCCGTGQLTKELSEKGFEVTGLDGSEEMINYARINAPKSNFILDDARYFNFNNKFNIIVSIYDSLNHITKSEDLIDVFRNVYSALTNNGVFAFDLNMEECFLNYWNSPFNIIDKNYVCTVNSKYNKEEKLACMELTTFKSGIENNWERSDFSIFERCYSEHDISEYLEEVGFENIQIIQLKRIGRAIFICNKFI